MRLNCVMAQLTTPTPRTDVHPLQTTFASIRQRLRAVATRILRSDADADDALQEAFVKLWQRRDGITDTRQAEAMSVTSVRNVCIDMLRHQAKHPHQALDEVFCQMPDDPAVNADRTDEVYRSVAAVIDEALSPLHREILYRRDHDGWDVDDIADHYSLSPANVRVILSRSRRAVREAYCKHTGNTPSPNPF